ncbi:MAG: hypothetical protein LBQ87_08585, partial [Candidatus Fibromonas sp.]|nr:hypothetical protein [Candidatus Fibromonas sp.]
TLPPQIGVLQKKLGPLTCTGSPDFSPQSLFPHFTSRPLSDTLAFAMALFDKIPNITRPCSKFFCLKSPF